MLLMVDSNWMPVLLPLSKEVPGVKWILPQAPLIPSSYNIGQSQLYPYLRPLPLSENKVLTYNTGTLFPAWFNTPTLNFMSPQDDIYHQDKAIHYLLSLIQCEYGEGVDVFIGGYSQGATMALYTALTSGVVVDGLAVVKGWVARSEIIRQVCQSWGQPRFRTDVI
jgi:pimeloyl-ACP methyl ester carboxylesterase